MRPRPPHCARWSSVCGTCLGRSRPRCRLHRERPITGVRGLGLLLLRPPWLSARQFVLAWLPILPSENGLSMRPAQRAGPRGQREVDAFLRVQGQDPGLDAMLQAALLGSRPARAEFSRSATIQRVAAVDVRDERYSRVSQDHTFGIGLLVLCAAPGVPERLEPEHDVVRVDTGHHLAG